MDIQMIFNNIVENLKVLFTNDMFEQIKTQNGKTQNSETIYKKVIEKVLENMKLTYKKASSQQPADYRIQIGDKILLLEIKKTDSLNIFFNDTCPSKELYYIIIFSGKKYKTKKDIKPQIIGINGVVFIEKCPWINDYKIELQKLKDKYKNMIGNMSVYPRPTYKSDIRFLLKN
jgi:frataxin-like iron-binding protein CyaY